MWLLVCSKAVESILVNTGYQLYSDTFPNDGCSLTKLSMNVISLTSWISSKIDANVLTKRAGLPRLRMCFWAILAEKVAAAAS